VNVNSSDSIPNTPKSFKKSLYAALEQRPYVIGLGIIVFIFIIYLPTMDTYLMGDDFEWLESAYQGWQNPGQLFQPINKFFRPLVKLSYLLNYTISGTDPALYNLLTAGLHLVNVFLLTLLMFRVTRRVAISGLIALTYGVSAYYSEVTLWAAARTESILLIFMLGVLLLLNNREEKNRRFRMVMVPVLAALASGAKETWVLLPFLALWFLWVVKQVPFKQALKETLGLFGLLAIYLAYFIGLPVLLGKTPPTSYGNLDIGNMIEKFGYMSFKYVGLGDAFSGAAWQYVLLFAALAGLAFLLFRRQNRLALFGLGWMLATMSISLPIYYSPSRYHYIPLVGFWIMVVALAADEIPRLAERFKVKKVLIYVVIGVALHFYGIYHTAVLQWEIKDYQKRGAMHKCLVDMYEKVKDRLPFDRPVVFIDLGKRKAVHEMASSVRGYQKLLFVREKAIWQQVFLGPLANFAGDPFKRLLEEVPANELDDVLNSEFTVLVFNDEEFFVPTVDEYKRKVLDYFRQHQELPFKVQVLRFVPGCLRRPGALFKKTAPGPRKNFCYVVHASYSALGRCFPLAAYIKGDYLENI
jgi:hypothetical protein